MNNNIIIRSIFRPLLLAICFFASANLQAQIKKEPKVISKVIVVPMEPKKTEKPKVSKVGDLSKSLPDNGPLKKFLATLPEKKKVVGGKTITTRLISEGGFTATSRIKEAGKSVKPAKKTEDEGQICQTYNVRASAESESFDLPYGTAAASIYPGAVYYYDDYYSNNVSPKPLEKPRNPIYVQAASSSGNGKSILVQEPSNRTLNEAIGQLKASQKKTATNESTSISMQAIYSEADFALNVTAGGGGFGYSAKAGFGISENSKHSYFMIDATQTFYTLTASLPENSDGAFFKDAAINGNNTVLYMATVSYGRRVIGVVETDFDSQEMYANFQAKFSAGLAQGSVGLDMLNSVTNSSTKVRLYFVGGQAAPIEIPSPTAASVQESINRYMRTTTSQDGVPIKFTFRNMKNEGMRYESATDNFTYQQCVPKKPEQKYKVSVALQTISNEKYEEVKFGIVQMANLYVGGNMVVQPGVLPTAAMLCWKEAVSAEKIVYGGCEEPRNFKNNTSVNKLRNWDRQVLQKEMDGETYIELRTDYIAMYATKFAGKTNEMNPAKKEKVYLRDVITGKEGGGSMRKEIKINFNGRVFTLAFLISVTPIAG